MPNAGHSLAVCCAVFLAALLGAPTAFASPLGQISENYGSVFFAGEKLGHVTAGADGSVWFIDDGTEGFVNGLATPPYIGEFTPSGGFSLYQQGLNIPGPTGGSLPYGLTSGPDGRMWFTDVGNPRAVGVVSATGQITEYTAGLNTGADPLGIAMGSDGNLWFADDGTTKAIGKSTPTGHIIEYTNGLDPGAAPQEVTLGPDGNIWFTDDGSAPAIGKITPGGQITEYSTGLNAGARPVGITSGADGNLWFADAGTTPAIGKITPAGQVTEYTTGLNSNSSPHAITDGGDGNLWFTDKGVTPAIGRITLAGQITEYSNGLATGADPVGIAAGPGGDLWFTDSAGQRPNVGQAGDGLPVLRGEGWEAGSNTATIAETINPGGLPTTYHVEFGPTTAYGSVTPPQSAGAGNVPIAVTVTLTPLVPDSVNYYRVVATNAAGTVYDDQWLLTAPASANPPPPTTVFTLPPIPPPTGLVPPPTVMPTPTASLSLIRPPTVKSTTVRVRLGCGGRPGQRCRGAVVLATFEHLVGSQVIGLSPRNGRSHRRPVTIGVKRFSIPTGALMTVTVTLNHTGVGLLRRFGRLPAVVLVSGAGLGRGTRSVVTFSGKG